jgi:hypothetical protein
MLQNLQPYTEMVTIYTARFSIKKTLNFARSIQVLVCPKYFLNLFPPSQTVNRFGLS